MTPTWHDLEICRHVAGYSMEQGIPCGWTVQADWVRTYLSWESLHLNISIVFLDSCFVSNYYIYVLVVSSSSG